MDVLGPVTYVCTGIPSIVIQKDNFSFKIKTEVTSFDHVHEVSPLLEEKKVDKFELKVKKINQTGPYIPETTKQ